MAKLMSGVWKPRSGVVRLDGADTFSWQREDFGRHCGYLPQDVELFSGSVRDNIARLHCAEQVADAEVIGAAKLAGIHDLVLRFPAGYETPVGFGGAALSAGQRQRIGLARALLGRPRLIVLDEPNSNLDAEGEIALLEALRSARLGGATIVMIGHRPSMLMDADLIAVLVDGQLQHFGSRNEILEKILPRSNQFASSKGNHEKA
ncbi:MAG: ATP-binding cassette domain-containing protein [Propionivibrio sp.]